VIYYDDNTQHYEEFEKLLSKYDMPFIEAFCKTLSINYYYDGYAWLDGYEGPLKHISTVKVGMCDDGYGSYYYSFVSPVDNYCFVNYWGSKVPFVIHEHTQEQVIQKFNRFQKLKAFL